MLQPPHIFRLSIHARVPPLTDPRTVLQRTDEVNSVLRILSNARISTVVLTGDPGAGKSTLAALLYRRLEAAVQTGQAPIRHFVWLSLGPNATLPDVIAAILGRIDMIGSDFFIHKSQEQISLLEQVLRRPYESTFVVLDQFEELLAIESSQGLVGRGAIALFLDLLQRDLGDSRVVLTCRRSPYNAQNGENMRVRTNLVSRISLPEGVALLQQRGVQGTPEEMSLIWQRCAGQVYGLVQFATLCTLSGFSLSYLLNSPDYVPVWNGEVTLNLIGAVYSFLSPIQRTLLRSLCLFSEPVPVEGVIIAITGEEGATALDVTTFERELGVLTWLSLVQHFSSENSKSSYFLHSLLCQYVMEHYLESSDRHPGGYLSIALGVTTEPNPILVNSEAREVALAAGHIRVAVYYACLAQQYCPPPQMRSGPQDVEPLLAMAHHLCLGWHWQQAYDLLCYEGLHESMMQWGAWNTLIPLYTAMVPPLGIVTRRDEGQIFSRLGLLYGHLGDYQQSRFYYEQALSTQREIGDQHGEAATLTNQGELLRSVGETQQARANFEQALMLNRREYDGHLESVLLHNLGLLSQNEKDYQRALQYYHQSLELAQNLQERGYTGMILTNIGMVLYEQGLLQEAVALLFSALEIRQSVQDRTVASLIRFLEALEQRIGREAFIHLRREAMGRREEVMARVSVGEYSANYNI
jgi:tetratricopeptide (TPR) repeat protein